MADSLIISSLQELSPKDPNAPNLILAKIEKLNNDTNSLNEFLNKIVKDKINYENDMVINLTKFLLQLPQESQAAVLEELARRQNISEKSIKSFKKGVISNSKSLIKGFLKILLVSLNVFSTSLFGLIKGTRNGHVVINVLGHPVTKIATTYIASQLKESLSRGMRDVIEPYGMSVICSTPTFDIPIWTSMVQAACFISNGLWVYPLIKNSADQLFWATGIDSSIFFREAILAHKALIYDNSALYYNQTSETASMYANVFHDWLLSQGLRENLSDDFAKVIDPLLSVTGTIWNASTVSYYSVKYMLFGRRNASNIFEAVDHINNETQGMLNNIIGLADDIQNLTSTTKSNLKYAKELMIDNLAVNLAVKQTIGRVFDVQGAVLAAIGATYNDEEILAIGLEPEKIHAITAEKLGIKSNNNLLGLDYLPPGTGNYLQLEMSPGRPVRRRKLKSPANRRRKSPARKLKSPARRRKSPGRK